MSWEYALYVARYRAILENRKIYVRGYRTRRGKWRYGTYDIPNPKLMNR